MPQPGVRDLDRHKTPLDLVSWALKSFELFCVFAVLVEEGSHEKRSCAFS